MSSDQPVKSRHILHVDMDAFYASIEQRDDPALRGLPVLVGGTGDRGVVAAASYEARRYGIHSAMPTRRARQLCPDAVFVRPRMAVYQAESARVFDVFSRYTPLIEALSLDEAFLDVTASERLLGSAPDIGQRIKAQIRDETGLVASVGVAPNKFLAKLASDHDKPDGFFIVQPERVRDFLDPLPIERMWGIGRKAAPVFRGAGITTIGQLRVFPADRLAGLVGRQRADHLRRLAAGVDDRPVVPDRAEKSVSNEVTLDQDLTTVEACRRVLLDLSAEVGRRLRAKALRGQTVVVKIRTREFRTYTRNRTLDHGTDADRVLFEGATALFDRWWRELGPAPIRLLGVGVTQLQPADQVDLFGGEGQRLDQLRDRIHDRFGASALRPATLVPRPAAGTDEDDD